MPVCHDQSYANEVLQILPNRFQLPLFYHDTTLKHQTGLKHYINTKHTPYIRGDIATNDLELQNYTWEY